MPMTVQTSSTMESPTMVNGISIENAPFLFGVIRMAQLIELFLFNVLGVNTSINNAVHEGLSNDCLDWIILQEPDVLFTNVHIASNGTLIDAGNIRISVT